MIQILPVADIYKEEIIVDDNFGQRQDGWETVESDTESAFFKMGRYIMENKTDSRWNYYHKALPDNLADNFIIKAEIEVVENNKGYGQYGLVWGFEEDGDYLNKFVASTEESSFVVSSFERNHNVYKHRFSELFFNYNTSGKKQFFSILKLDGYYYFFLNKYDRPNYVVHASHLPMFGDRFGFYIEPGLKMVCESITVKNLYINPKFDGHIWMPVGEDLMPMGSVLLRGN